MPSWLTWAPNITQVWDTILYTGKTHLTKREWRMQEVEDARNVKCMPRKASQWAEVAQGRSHVFCSQQCMSGAVHSLDSSYRVTTFSGFQTWSNRITEVFALLSLNLTVVPSTLHLQWITGIFPSRLITLFQQAFPGNPQDTLTREAGRLIAIFTSPSFPPYSIPQSHPQFCSILHSLLFLSDVSNGSGPSPTTFLPRPHLTIPASNTSRHPQETLQSRDREAGKLTTDLHTSLFSWSSSRSAPPAL